MYFLYKNKYRIFKPVETTIRRGLRVERRKIEGMNQFSYNTHIHGNVTMKFPV
jgi:hypothetical protein